MAASWADSMLELSWPIREFRKHPKDKQAVYVSAAVSMLAYTYTANGGAKKAR